VSPRLFYLIFTQIVGNEMYIHAGDEAEAWLRYRQSNEI
jgi:hypothetical protein